MEKTLNTVATFIVAFIWNVVIITLLSLAVNSILRVLANAGVKAASTPSEVIS